MKTNPLSLLVSEKKVEKMRVSVVNDLEPAVLNTAQAAKYIGLSKSELDKARVSGELGGDTPPKFFRVGKKIVRYHIADLDDWLGEQQRFRSLAEQTSVKSKNSI